ncbi:MAG: (d)CMP kinase [Lachnospiraceae bacterium]|nr:(d)CMP kinase [Lachnospiraceae bacterium]
MGFDIAIDGPAGAGKSTIAKGIAKRMGFIYVDTGALYRAVGLYMLDKGIPTDDRDKVSAALPEITVDIEYENEEQQVLLLGKNVTPYLRTQEVGEAASVTSAYPEVRDKLLDLQRTLAEKYDVVMDGRDIGTVVLPDADLKIYLTADSRVRAKRRFDELKAKGGDPDFFEVLKEVEERDYRDSHRETAPLKQADDAVLLDSSRMSVEEVLCTIEGLIREKRA